FMTPDSLGLFNAAYYQTMPPYSTFLPPIGHTMATTATESMFTDSALKQAGDEKSGNSEQQVDDSFLKTDEDKPGKKIVEIDHDEERDSDAHQQQGTISPHYSHADVTDVVVDDF